jgi:hypothetical protein
MRPLLLLSTLALILSANAVLAQKLYRWTDENGKVHYTDQLPPEAAKAARDELNEAGRAVDHVERAMTPEERAAWEAEQAQAAEAQRLAEEQAKLDEVLLASYVTEADLERAYGERFDLLDRSITSTEASAASQSKSLTDLLNHAAGLERSGQVVPANIAQSIVRTRTQAKDQRSYLAKHRADRRELQKDFDTALARYRNAKAAAAKAGS